jgi:ATP-dependent RNA helicase DeaD
MDVTKFEELQLDDRIIRAITEMGFEEASPIQAQAIPVVLEGRDMIGQAQTGTGKTAAFGLPLLQKVDPKVKKLQAIVLLPTRELKNCAVLQNLCTASRFCLYTAVRTLSVRSAP